jgi:2Fe-2S ferredoxin
MATITFIEHSGQQHSIDIEAGKSVMQHAVDNGIPGIDAACGGECACGTCHAIIGERWAELVNPPSDDENMMLDMTPERDKNSRLCCQIKADNSLNGMTVSIPEFQM